MGPSVPIHRGFFPRRAQGPRGTDLGGMEEVLGTDRRRGGPEPLSPLPGGLHPAVAGCAVSLCAVLSRGPWRGGRAVVRGGEEEEEASEEGSGACADPG